MAKNKRDRTNEDAVRDSFETTNPAADTATSRSDSGLRRAASQPPAKPTQTSN